MTAQSRSRHRLPTRKAAPVAGVQRPANDAAPGLIGGLLRDQPELALLQKAAAGLASIELVDDRIALVSTILARRPGAVVLPAFDVDRTSTAPLVLRVRREAPTVAVLVVAVHPRGAGQPLLRAIQAGAHVVTAPAPSELRTALAAVLGPLRS